MLDVELPAWEHENVSVEKRACENSKQAWCDHATSVNRKNSFSCNSAVQYEGFEVLS